MAYKAALIFCILLLSFPTEVEGGPICYASCLAAVGVGGYIAGAAIRPLPEFTSIVIAGGLWAAAWMASYGGAIPAGSQFAEFQEVGAAGVIRRAFGSISGFCSASCTLLP